jgi:hypothetical protein
VPSASGLCCREYFTYNTCIEPCQASECGFYAQRMNNIIPERGPKALCAPGVPPAEIFRNCADVVITGGDSTSGPGPITTPVVLPVVTPVVPPIVPGPVAPPVQSRQCPDTFAACAAWGPSTCGLPGVAPQCPCMCGSTGSSSNSGGVTSPGPVNGGGSCVDSHAACPGWQGLCSTPGVATTCPCMCGASGPQSG